MTSRVPVSGRKSLKRVCYANISLFCIVATISTLSLFSVLRIRTVVAVERLEEDIHYWQSPPVRYLNFKRRVGPRRCDSPNDPIFVGHNAFVTYDNEAVKEATCDCSACWDAVLYET